MGHLHFGVEDKTYLYRKKLTNTHEVADILEARYKIIERFVRDNEDEIRAMVLEQANRTARAAVKGRPSTPKKMLDDIKVMFRRYIMAKRLDGRGLGWPIPTKASLLGINHRLKHPYRKGNPARPSFYDTGLYVSAFKAWVK